MVSDACMNRPDPRRPLQEYRCCRPWYFAGVLPSPPPLLVVACTSGSSTTTSLTPATTTSTTAATSTRSTTPDIVGADLILTGKIVTMTDAGVAEALAIDGGLVVTAGEAASNTGVAFGGITDVVLGIECEAKLV